MSSRSKKKNNTSAKIISQEYMGFLAFVAAALVLFGFSGFLVTIPCSWLKDLFTRIDWIQRRHIYILKRNISELPYL